MKLRKTSWLAAGTAACLLLLAACSSSAEPTAQPPAAEPTATTAPVPPAETPAEMPTEAPAEAPTEVPEEPEAGSAPQEGGPAHVDSVDVLMLESFPVQVNAVVRGNLPDPCTEIAGGNVTLDGNTFIIDIVTTRQPDAMCAQVLAPFEETVPLNVSGLPAGEYTVSVGGVQGTFTLSVDNVPQADLPTGEVNFVETDVKFVLAAEDVPIYNSPSADGEEIGFVAGGMIAGVTGASADGLWWRVICPDGSTGNCWISADPKLTQPASAP